MEIFIPFNVPSLKNSKIKTTRGIFPSKTFKKYLQAIGIQHFSSSKKIIVEYKTRENLFRKVFEENNWVKPDGLIVLGYHFIRKSKHKWDFDNAIATVNDLLTAHDFIEDDNMDWLIPMPMKKDDKWYSYDKNNPGVILKVLNE